MIQLKGSVTTVERMDVEVTPQELSKHTIKNFTPYEITRMAYASWLAGKGMGTDVELKQNSLGAYYFQEYEDNGSHYSGYYEVSNAYKEGDEVIWEQFHQLLNTLK